jgi:hypothetical protein
MSWNRYLYTYPFRKVQLRGDCQWTTKLELVRPLTGIVALGSGATPGSTTNRKSTGSKHTASMAAHWDSLEKVYTLPVRWMDSQLFMKNKEINVNTAEIFVLLGCCTLSLDACWPSFQAVLRSHTQGSKISILTQYMNVVNSWHIFPHPLLMHARTRYYLLRLTRKWLLYLYHTKLIKRN